MVSIINGLLALYVLFSLILFVRLAYDAFEKSQYLLGFGYGAFAITAGYFIGTILGLFAGGDFLSVALLIIIFVSTILLVYMVFFYRSHTKSLEESLSSVSKELYISQEKIRELEGRIKKITNTIVKKD